jgi:hypothetical protein
MFRSPNHGDKEQVSQAAVSNQQQQEPCEWMDFVEWNIRKSYPCGPVDDHVDPDDDTN